MVMKMDHHQLQQIARMLGDGTLTVRIGEVLPLAEARKAHEDLEGHKIHGKIVLEPTN
jgi:NADPH2:quinone reductase